MSIITQLERYSGYSETTLNGVLESAATYEVVDNVLIIRNEQSMIPSISQRKLEKN